MKSVEKAQENNATDKIKGSYNFGEIEEKWRSFWLHNKTYKTSGPGEEGFDDKRPKCYILDMFPYPSGSGLHMGHPKGYIASDIYSRYKGMQGFNVLHPMGFDSFGLPAEQFAVENNIHPAESTERNIKIIRKQLQYLGLSYDWNREIATSRLDYYRWTQWIFLQMFEAWFDPDFAWCDAGGRSIKGKARPIAELVEGFKVGTLSFSDADKNLLGVDSEKPWVQLSDAQQSLVLNNYRLAYQKEVTVNWCPGLGTVLANEEVTNEGKSERGDFPVYKRPLKQWMMRIIDYADRLLADLDEGELPDGSSSTFKLDWPEPIKLMQKNWIGYSEGAMVYFDIMQPQNRNSAGVLDVFTTRPDTLFGSTFMVVAPQHPIVRRQGAEYLVPSEWPQNTRIEWKGPDPQLDIHTALANYIAAAEQNADLQREDRDKTGIFSGIMARNPVNDKVIPIFVADYVSIDYGSGAIMAVPAHDERDFEFAKKFGLEIIEVVQPPSNDLAEECYTGEGTSINSPSNGGGEFAISGLKTQVAKKKITAALESARLGRAAVNYKLRDWIFSRQRYWGEPFPLAVGADNISKPTQLPVELPDMDDFKPLTSDDPLMPVTPPLSRADENWQKIEIEGSACQRDLNVMPQWAGSCWYYLRFIDPSNDAAFCQDIKEAYFMPVDLYIGGAEHAVLHLLYARFWHKVLYDLGHVSTPEPFKKLFNQGMITADAFTDDRGVYIDIREVEMRDDEPYHLKTGEKLQRFSGKMGKRFKNGLPPEEVGSQFGVDTFRLYEMYMGPLEASTPWSMEGIRGMQRFLHRVWRNFIQQDRSPKQGGEFSEDLKKLIHKTIKRVTEDIEALRFNTAIAALIELNNQLVKLPLVPVEASRIFLLLLAPFAPHIAEEIWEIYDYGNGDISKQSWPIADESLIVEKTISIPIQVNGKMRGKVDVPAEISEEDLRQLILDMDNIKRHIDDIDKIKRVIIVPGKIVNIVA